MQKSCFLGPTIFKIPQPNWRYYSTVIGAAIKCKPYSEITVEIGTQWKTVKIATNIFAVSLVNTTFGSSQRPSVSLQGTKAPPPTCANYTNTVISPVMPTITYSINEVEVKVSKYQKQFLMSKLLPKNERNSLSWVKKMVKIVRSVCFLEKVLTP